MTSAETRETPMTSGARLQKALSFSSFRSDAHAPFKHRDRPPTTLVQLATSETTVRRLEDECSVLIEQRERVSRDLHDHTIGRLFGIGLSLESLVTSPQGARAGQRIEHAVEEIRLAIAELRSATLERPTDAGVSSSIAELRTDAERLVSDKTRFTSVVVVFDAAGPSVAIPGVVRAHLLAALSEAVMNVLKHARANTIWIRIDSSPEQLVLAVADDGCGIDPTRPLGDGRRNIGVRAAQLGGSSSFESREMGGTIVRLAVPIAQAQSVTVHP